jgi:chromosome segregation ATPase
MHRAWLFALSFLFLSGSGFGQSTSSDSQGMQALVAEVRELRKDLQTANGYALKAQVLLFRLQVQEATVARVSQHLNDLRLGLAQIQDHKRRLENDLKRLEKFVDNNEGSPTERKEAEEQISGLKTQIQSLAVEEQQKQTTEMEAEEQLRTEQAKLSALEERVDRLEKDLGSNPH